MYTIIMRDDKVLETTVKTALYQREKLVDKIQFLFPQIYGIHSLSEFTAVLKYVDPIGEAHSEILTLSDELYKDKLRYVLPVDTNLTKYAGDIKIRITLSKTDLDNSEQYVLHTSSTIITILSVDDYYNFNPDPSLEFIDQILGKMDAKIQLVRDTAEFYRESKADDIVRVDDSDGAKIQLTSEGVPIGKPVSIEQPEIPVVDLSEDSVGDDTDSEYNNAVEF